MAQPDLRTKDGAKQFLNYHSPNEESRKLHEVINKEFQVLLDNTFDFLPDGPGKTRYIHKLNEARMAANSCIANEGA